MLSHITEAATIIIPISTECGMYTVCAVWLIRCRTQPHVVIQFFRHLLHWKLLLSYPVEFPVKSRMLTDGDLQRPAQHPCIDYFFDFLYRHIHSITVSIKSKPCLYSDNIAVLASTLLDLCWPADGTWDRSFTPDSVT